MNTIPTKFASNEWVNLSISIDKSNSNISFYNNGEKIQSIDNSNIDLSKIVDSQLIMGKSDLITTNTNYFVDNVQIYNSALSDEEIRDNYNLYRLPKLENGKLSHIAANYNSYKKELEFYHNGSNIGKIIDYNANDINANNNPIHIGNFNGELGDISYFNNILFDSEVKHLNDKTKYSTSKNIFHYECVENDSNVLLDSSGNSLDATITRLSGSGGGIYEVGHRTNTSSLYFDGDQSTHLYIDQNYDINNMILSTFIKPKELNDITYIIKQDDTFYLSVSTFGVVQLSLSPEISSFDNYFNSIPNLLVHYDANNLTYNENDELSTIQDLSGNNYNGLIYKQDDVSSYIKIKQITDENGVTKQVFEANYSTVEVFNNHELITSNLGHVPLTNGYDMFIVFYIPDDYVGVLPNYARIIQGKYGNLLEAWTNTNTLTFPPIGVDGNIQSSAFNESNIQNKFILVNINTKFEEGKFFMMVNNTHFEFSTSLTNEVTLSTLNLMLFNYTNTDWTQTWSPGHISEFLVFDRNLTDFERTNIYNNLSNKFLSTNKQVNLYPTIQSPLTTVEIDEYSHISVAMNKIDSTVSFYKNATLTEIITNVNFDISLNTSPIVIGENFVGSLTGIRMDLGFINDIQGNQGNIADTKLIDGDIQQLQIVGYHHNTGTLSENNTKVTWNINSWYNFTTDIIIDTNEIGKVYIFELSVVSGNPYLILHFQKLDDTNYNQGYSAVNKVSLLLNWHGTLIKHDGNNPNKVFYENGASRDTKYWKLTIVEHENGYNGQTNGYNDIFVEAFLSIDRTPESRTLYTYASEMGHGGYWDRSSLFANNDKFRLGLGGHQTGSFYFQDFHEVIHVPIYSSLFIEPNYNKVNVLLSLNFDESSSDTVIDYSALQNNGIIVNGAVRKSPSYVTDSRGLLLDKDYNQYVQLNGDVYSKINFNSITLSAWVKLSDMDSSKHSIISKENSFSWCVNESKYLQFEMGSITTTSTQLVLSNQIWCHLTTTIDQFANKITFFKDGVKLDSITVDIFNIQASSSNIHIGSMYNGELDNVMIHNCILSDDVIKDLSISGIHDYQAQTIVAGTWTHIAASYNKKMNMMCIYQNGEYSGCYEDYLHDFSQIGTNSKNMYIATTGDNVTFYDGKLDDVRVYNRALKHDEILDLYNMYVTQKSLIQDTIFPSYSNNKIIIGNVTLREPANMTESRIIEYYSFATLDNSLNGMSDIKAFINNISTLSSEVYYKYSLTLTGSETTEIWNAGSFEYVINNNNELISVNMINTAYVYVVGVAYDDTVYYVKEIISITQGSKVNVANVVYDPYTNILNVNVDIYNNLYNMKKLYVAAFKYDVSTQTNEQLHNKLRNAHTSKINVSLINVAKITLANIENKSLSYAFTNKDNDDSERIVANYDYTILAMVEDSSYVYKINLGTHYDYYQQFNIEGTSDHIVNNYELVMNKSGTETYLTTGITIDMTDEHIGVEYIFEYYFERDTSDDVIGHGGITFGNMNSTARQITNSTGFYIDFYQRIQEKQGYRYVGPTNFKLYNGYTVNDTSNYNGKWARYFKVTIVSEGKKHTTRNDLKLQAYLDEARTILVWEIPNMSHNTNYSGSSFTENSVYINLWKHTYGTMIFKNFKKLIRRSTPFGLGVGNYNENTILTNELHTLSTSVKHSQITEVYSEENLRVEYTGGSWSTLICKETMIDTSDIDNYYEFELGPTNIDGGNGYLTLGIYKSVTGNVTNWNSDAESVVMLMSTTSTTLTNTVAADSTYVNGNKIGVYWRLSIVERTVSGITLNDVKYEMFTDISRTLDTLSYWGYASKMHHHNNDNGVPLFQNNTIFYVAAGLHPGGSSRYFANFTSYNNKPKPINKLSNVSITNLMIDPPYQQQLVSQEYESNTITNETISVHLTGSTIAKSTYYILATTKSLTKENAIIEINNNIDMCISNTLEIDESLTLTKKQLINVLTDDNEIVNVQTCGNFNVWVYITDNTTYGKSIDVFNVISNETNPIVKVLSTKYNRFDDKLLLNYGLTSLTDNINNYYIAAFASNIKLVQSISVLQIGDLELDIQNYDTLSNTLQNKGTNVISTSFSVDGGGIPLKGQDIYGTYIELTTSHRIALISELPLLTSETTDYTIFYAFSVNSLLGGSLFLDLFGTNSRNIISQSGTIGNVIHGVYGTDLAGTITDVEVGDFIKIVISYNSSDENVTEYVYNSRTDTLISNVHNYSIGIDQTRFTINSGSATENLLNHHQKIYAFKLYKKHITELQEVYDDFIQSNEIKIQPIEHMLNNISSDVVYNGSDVILQNDIVNRNLELTKAFITSTTISMDDNFVLLKYYPLAFADNWNIILQNIKLYDLNDIEVVWEILTYNNTGLDIGPDTIASNIDDGVHMHQILTSLSNDIINNVPSTIQAPVYTNRPNIPYSNGYELQLMNGGFRVLNASQSWGEFIFDPFTQYSIGTKYRFVSQVIDDTVIGPSGPSYWPVGLAGGEGFKAFVTTLYFQYSGGNIANLNLIRLDNSVIVINRSMFENIHKVHIQFEIVTGSSASTNNIRWTIYDDDTYTTYYSTNTGLTSELKQIYTYTDSTGSELPGEVPFDEKLYFFMKAYDYSQNTAIYQNTLEFVNFVTIEKTSPHLRWGLSEMYDLSTPLFVIKAPINTYKIEIDHYGVSYNKSYKLDIYNKDDDTELYTFTSTDTSTQYTTNDISFTDQIDYIILEQSLQIDQTYNIVIVGTDTSFDKSVNLTDGIGYDILSYTYRKVNSVGNYYDWHNHIIQVNDTDDLVANNYINSYVIGPDNYLYLWNLSSPNYLKILQRTDNYSSFNVIQPNQDISSPIRNVTLLNDTQTIFHTSTSIVLYDKPTNVFITSSISYTLYNSQYTSVCGNDICIHLDDNSYINVYKKNTNNNFIFVERFNSIPGYSFDKTSIRFSNKYVNNKLVIYDYTSTTQYTLYVIEWDGTTLQNVAQTIDLLDNDGNRYITPYCVDLSDDGVYIFISGFGTSVPSINSQIHGMMYIYQHNDTEYTNIGSVKPDSDKYKNYFGYQITSNGNYVSILDKECYKSEASNSSYESKMYLYEFNKFEFNVDHVYIYYQHDTTQLQRISLYDNVLVSSYANSLLFIESLKYTKESELRYPPACIEEYQSTNFVANNATNVALYDEYSLNTTKWTLSNLPYGNGQYEVYSSKSYNNNTFTHHIIGSFDRTLSGKIWHSPVNTNDMWGYIILPDKIKLTKYAFYTNDVHSHQCVKDWEIYGKIGKSSSDDTYVLLDTQSNVTSWSNWERKEFIIVNPTNTKFDMFKINITGGNNATYVVLPQIEFFGYPDYPPEYITTLSTTVSVDILDVNVSINPLQISATIFGSSANYTTYYILGTTLTLTKQQVKESIITKQYDTSHIVSGRIEQGKHSKINVAIPNIMNDSTMVSSDSVNVINMWVYATDGVGGEDIQMVTFDNVTNNIVINVTNSEFVTINNTNSMTYTVFNNFDTITNVYTCMFDYNVTSKSNEELYNFIITNLSAHGVDHQEVNISSKTVTPLTTDFTHVFTSYVGDEIEFEKEKTFYIVICILDSTFNSASFVDGGVNIIIHTQNYRNVIDVSVNYSSITNFFTCDDITSNTENPTIVDLDIQEIFTTYNNGYYILLKDLQTVYFYGNNKNMRGTNTSENTWLQPTKSITIENYIKSYPDKEISFITGGYGGCVVVFTDNTVYGFGTINTGVLLNVTNKTVMIEAFGYVNELSGYKKINDLINIGGEYEGYIPKIGCDFGNNSSILILEHPKNNNQVFVYDSAYDTETRSAVLNILDQLYTDSTYTTSVKRVNYIHSVSGQCIIYELVDLETFESEWYFMNTMNNKYSYIFDYLPTTQPSSSWTTLYLPIRLDLLEPFIFDNTNSYKFDFIEYHSNFKYLTYIKTNLSTNTSSMCYIESANNHVNYTNEYTHQVDGYIIATNAKDAIIKMTNVNTTIYDGNVEVRVSSVKFDLSTSTIKVNGGINGSSDTLSIYTLFATTLTLTNVEAIAIITSYMNDKEYLDAIKFGLLEKNQLFVLEDFVIENVISDDNTVVSLNTITSGGINVWMHVADDNNRIDITHILTPLTIHITSIEKQTNANGDNVMQFNDSIIMSSGPPNDIYVFCVMYNENKPTYTQKELELLVDIYTRISVEGTDFIKFSESNKDLSGLQLSKVFTGINTGETRDILNEDTNIVALVIVKQGALYYGTYLIPEIPLKEMSWSNISSYPPITISIDSTEQIVNSEGDLAQTFINAYVVSDFILDDVWVFNIDVTDKSNDTIEEEFNEENLQLMDTLLVTDVNGNAFYHTSNTYDINLNSIYLTHAFDQVGSASTQAIDSEKIYIAIVVVKDVDGKYYAYKGVNDTIEYNDEQLLTKKHSTNNDIIGFSDLPIKENNISLLKQDYNPIDALVDNDVSGRFNVTLLSNHWNSSYINSIQSDKNLVWEWLDDMFSNGNERSVYYGTQMSTGFAGAHSEDYGNGPNFIWEMGTSTLVTKFHLGCGNSTRDDWRFHGNFRLWWSDDNITYETLDVDFINDNTHDVSQYGIICKYFGIEMTNNGNSGRYVVGLLRIAGKVSKISQQTNNLEWSQIPVIIKLDTVTTNTSDITIQSGMVTSVTPMDNVWVFNIDTTNTTEDQLTSENLQIMVSNYLTDTDAYVEYTATIDQSLDGIVLTKAFDNIGTSATSTILDTNTYYTLIVVKQGGDYYGKYKFEFTTALNMLSSFEDDNTSISINPSEGIPYTINGVIYDIASIIPTIESQTSAINHKATLLNGDVIWGGYTQQNSASYSVRNMFCEGGSYWAHMPPYLFIYEFQTSKLVTSIQYKNSSIYMTDELHVFYYNGSDFELTTNQTPTILESDTGIVTFDNVITNKLAFYGTRKSASGYYGLSWLKIFGSSPPLLKSTSLEWS
jgi:hypothetical protein